jgi:hypothetical protein
MSSRKGRTATAAFIAYGHHTIYDAKQAENDRYKISSQGIQTVSQAKLQENTTNLNRLK